MPKTINSTELQDKTGEVIDWLQMGGDSVVVEINGEPVAAILSLEEYQSYRQYRQARVNRFARLRRFAAENAGAGRLTEAEALALIDKARQEIFDAGDREA